MHGVAFKLNHTPAKESIRARQLPGAQSGVIMAPNETSFSTPEPEALPLSNLEKFLDAVTPRIPGKKRNIGTNFLLNDLWESFHEWSAYGAGAPLVLHDGDHILQYYVPYLSAMQIYAHLKPTPKSSMGIKDREGECSSKGSSSDASINSEQERISANINSHQTTNLSLILGKLSLREQKVVPQENLSTDDSESANSRGNLLYEYFEKDPPFTRKPLYEKISELASKFPELKSMRSCDLHPFSWFSVAWYPIYRIPTGRTLKYLDSSFLTYHSLCTSTKCNFLNLEIPYKGAFGSSLEIGIGRGSRMRPKKMTSPSPPIPKLEPNKGYIGKGAFPSLLTYPSISVHIPFEPSPGTPNVHAPPVYQDKMSGSPKIVLPSFGLSSYKFRGSMWVGNNERGNVLLNTLSNGANNWLKFLKVHHPDHSFFVSKR